MRFFVLAFLCACGSTPLASDAGDAMPTQMDAATSDASSMDASVDVTNDTSTEMFPAYKDLPKLLSYGGPVMSAPKFVPIFFANEDGMRKTQLLDFLGKLAASSYWTATTSEYGVGALAIASAVNLNENAPASISDNAIETWLANAIAMNKVPAASKDIIYGLYYPASTTITGGSIGTSCTGWGGYHGEVQAGNANVAYTVVPACTSYNARLAPGDVVMGIDHATGLTTHEIIETVTDPYPSSQPAYASIDAAHRAWQLYLYGAEIADTCEMEPGAFYKDNAIGYVVQRMFSNAAAAKGSDPCVPAAGSPFVAAYPYFKVPFGPSVNQGASTTIEIRLASDGPTNGPFSVKAIDYNADRGKAPLLELTLDKTMGKNGDVLMLTVKVLSIGSMGYEGYLLETQLGNVRRRIAGLVHQ